MFNLTYRLAEPQQSVTTDVVKESNLQRQVLYGSLSIGQKKSSFAKQSLEALNSSITVHEYSVRLTEEWVEKLFPDYDIIVDATDNFSSRLLINSGCVKFKKPLVSASVYQFEGQVSVFNYQNGPCYECLFPITEREVTSDLSCSSAGIFSTSAGIIGTIQANEVLKLIIGLGEPLSGRLFLFDSLGLKTQILNYSKNANCPRCNGLGKLDTDRIFSEETIRIERNDSRYGLKPSELWDLIKSDEGILLLDVRPSEQAESTQIPGSRKIAIIDVLQNSTVFHNSDSKKIVLYCGSELRAKRTADNLRVSGVPAYYLIGGMRQWIAQMLPLEAVE